MSPTAPTPPAPETDAQTRPLSVGFVHLGCVKNLIDSEKLLGNLAADGRFVVGGDPDAADVVIVNTCGFLEASRAESLAAIREVVARKHEGKVGRVVVAGCLAQKDRGLIEREAAGIDAILGVADREAIAELCATPTGSERAPGSTASETPVTFRVGSADRPPDPDDGRLRLTPRHLAYLRVSEGCDHPCTFCSIPGIRGRNKSKPIESLVAEARELVADGARELIIVGQDTADYGRDLYGSRRLHEVLARLGEVEGLAWIRVLYAHPANVDEALIRELTTNPRVVPYLDMPIQHGADRVLKRMLRRTTRAEIEEKVARLRAASSRHFFVRTTVIAGFPGETAAELDEMLGLLERVRFDRLGCFAYSFEADTPPARLDGHLPLVEREARRDLVMRTQMAIGHDIARSLVGTTIEAIVDTTRGASAIGRTYGDCPEDDPVIALAPGSHRLRSGDIVMARVDSGAGYDLCGTVESIRSRS